MERMAIGRKKRALIQIAKKDLKLDEKSYHQILKGVAGVENATELTKKGFEMVMKRFEKMGFKGLLLDPYQPIPKGRLIPPESPQGEERITANQLGFVDYLLEKLSWDEGHYHAFCRRIIKKPEPLTKRDGQKMIIGLMAILRQKAMRERKGS
jgi:hypothetical protein